MDQLWPLMRGRLPDRSGVILMGDIAIIYRNMREN
jgi:hypothetical protein